MHDPKFEALYEQYTGFYMDAIKSYRLNPSSYSHPRLSSANVWYRIGVLAGQGVAVEDILNIIEEEMK